MKTKTNDSVNYPCKLSLLWVIGAFSYHSLFGTNHIIAKTKWNVCVRNQLYSQTKPSKFEFFFSGNSIKLLIEANFKKII